MAPRKTSGTASSADGVQDLLEGVISKSSDWWRKELRTHPVANEQRLDALLDRHRRDWSAEDEDNLLERFNESQAKAAVDKLPDRDKVALTSVSKVSLQLQGCSPLGIFNPLVGREYGEDKKRGSDGRDKADSDFGNFAWPRNFSEKLEMLLVYPDYWGEGRERLGTTLDFIARYNSRSKAPWEVQGAHCRVLLSFNKSPRSRTVGQRLKEVYESNKSHCTTCECRVFYEFMTRFSSSGRKLRRDTQLRAEVGQITASDLRNLITVLDDIDRKRGNLVTRAIQHRMYKRHRAANGLPSHQRLVEFTTRCLLKYGQDRVLELRGGSEGSEGSESAEAAETSDAQSDESQEGDNDDQLPTPHTRRRGRPAVRGRPMEQSEASEFPEDSSPERPGAAPGHTSRATTTSSAARGRRSRRSVTRPLSQADDSAFESPPPKRRSLSYPSSEASDGSMGIGDDGFDAGLSVDDMDDGPVDDAGMALDFGGHEPSPTPSAPQATTRLPPMRRVMAYVNGEEEGEGDDEGDEMELFNAA